MTDLGPDSSAASGEAETEPHPAVLIAAIGLLALIGLALTRQVEPVGYSVEGDPGPQLLPAFATVGLLAVCALLAIQHWLARRTSEGPAVGEGVSGNADRVEPRSFLRLVPLAALLAVYLIALAAWGLFSPLTWLFATGVMICLGSRWWQATGTALLLVVWIKLLFTWLFEIPLPEGVLEAWI